MDYLERRLPSSVNRQGSWQLPLRGKPCPVCGSTTHPNKAVPTADAPSEEELKKLKEKVDLSREDMERASNKSATKLTEEKLAKEQLIRDAKVHFPMLEEELREEALKSLIELALDQNNENKKESDDKYLKLKDQLARKSEATKQLKLIQEALKDCEELMDKQEEERNNITAVVASKEGALRTLKSSLEYENRHQAEMTKGWESQLDKLKLLLGRTSLHKARVNWIKSDLFKRLSGKAK